MRKRMKIITIAAAACLLALLAAFSHRSKEQVVLSPYPDGKIFAFTVTDDPDLHEVAAIRPVYDCLAALGLHTTIAAWVGEAHRSNGMPDVPGRFDFGQTLQDREYRDYILSLKDQGFEVAMHTVSGGNDTRQETARGYEEFKKIVGYYPRINIMHSNNLENAYWGRNVFHDSRMRWFFDNIVALIYPKAAFPFSGEDPDSPYFWGDILQSKTSYVRLWGTSGINTLRFNPSMPYHDPATPWVNYWFSFSEGHTGQVFNRLLEHRNIEKLVRERGACIVYTHFASDFAPVGPDGNRQLNPVTRHALEDVARHGEGWFVPVSVLLDRLQLMKNVVLFDTPGALVVTNLNGVPVDRVTVIVPQGTRWYTAQGKPVTPDPSGNIVIARIAPRGSLAFFKDAGEPFCSNAVPGRWEYFDFIRNRLSVWAMTRLDR